MRLHLEWEANMNKKSELFDTKAIAAQLNISFSEESLLKKSEKKIPKERMDFIRKISTKAFVTATAQH
jgi:hypothetical protein